MVVLRFLRWLFGYVVFQGNGLFPERFMNLCARGEINLWDVRCTSGVMRACVAKSDYSALRAVARKSKMRLRVKQRHGLPFHTRKYKGRLGLLVGAVLFFVVLYVLSLYVWDVEVNGNVALTKEQVLTVMSDIGVRPGALKSDLKAKLMEQQAMVALPELSWIAINQQGSVVSVELKEREVPPESVPQDEPCNMISTSTGQVVRLEVYTGTAAVKAGDAVIKGQLLINGVVEDAMGNSVLKHATGKIFAATRHTLRVEVPLEQTVAVQTGNVITRKRVSVFGIDLPVSIASIPDEGYTCQMTKEPLTIGGAKLPVTIYTETWTQQVEKQVTLTEEEASQQAREQIAQKEGQELSGIEIIDRRENAVLENGVYILEVQYDCEENIAQESPILLQ